jgi:hypothetical protein
MRSILCLAAAGLWLGVIAVAAPQDSTPDTSKIPTYTKDVAQILFRNCTSCHRPGEIAPMSLLTYADVRPEARAIRDKIADGIMPPWHTDMPHGTFLNERGLTEEEKHTILLWVANGAPKGDPKDMPPAPEYPQGWSIGVPDAVLEMQEDYKIPADGVVAYEYFYIPTNFTEPKWVQAIEVRPGNRAVVHHVLVNYKAKPDLQRAPALKFNQELQRQAQGATGLHPANRADNIPARLIGTYAPGTNPQVFRPGTALRLEPGGVIELQMHYTANGEAGTDRTRIGLIFSQDPSPREVRASQFYNTTLSLPAGARDVAVNAEVEFLQDATVWGLFPHTHVRGKKWEYVLQLPDGTKTTILSVPRYDFNWQTYYMFKQPLQVPKGARILSTAWYDNSTANRSNPDPTANVKWGDQTWEEMQYSGLLYSPSIPATPMTPPGGGGPR